METSERRLELAGARLERCTKAGDFTCYQDNPCERQRIAEPDEEIEPRIRRLRVQYPQQPDAVGHPRERGEPRNLRAFEMQRGERNPEQRRNEQENVQRVADDQRRDRETRI